MTPVQRQIMMGGITLIALYLIFEVPYLFPPAIPTISASYDYGFNNTIGLLLLISISMVFFGLGFRWAPKDLTPLIGQTTQKKALISSRDLEIMTIVSLAVITPLAILSGNRGFLESQQFFLAMDRIAIGQRMYTDFDFYYGPLLGYGPYALYKFGAFLKFDHKTAYFISLAILQLIGLAQLRFILNNLTIKSNLARKIFYAIAFSTLPLHAGINLILFRFLTPVASLLILEKMEPKQPIPKFIAIVTLSCLTYGISIEYGVILTIAIICYFFSSLLIKWQLADFINIVLALISPVIFYLFFPELFNTMHLYLIGAWRWPFAISLSLLLFFICVFTVAFFMGSQLRDGIKNYFSLTLCLLSFGSLPAALGRCDPGHVLLNGLMVMIIAYIYISNFWPNKMVKIIGYLLVLQFGILYNFTSLRVYTSFYATLAQNMFVKLDRSKDIDYELAFKGLTMISTPWPLPEKVSNFLDVGNNSKFLYFKDFSIIASAPEVDIAIEDLKNKNPDFLILPSSWEQIINKEDYFHTINYLFNTRYIKERKRNGRELLIPLVDFIKNNYVAYDETGNVVILRRKAITLNVTPPNSK